ncbi:MAG: DUF438 domain-containing protein [Bacteroidales bacterium]|nr:DUF438 domain-containing protein [Bacteroidales bacterium]
MSEYINNARYRAENLSLFFLEMTEQKNKGIDIVNRYKTHLENTHPYDVLIATDRLMQHKFDLNVVKSGVNKSINMLYKSLKDREIPDYSSYPFFRELAMENVELDLKLQKLKPLLKALNDEQLSNKKRIENFQKLLTGITELEAFTSHYVKKENILFPSIENHLKEHGCQPLMWSYHDDVRKGVKEILSFSSETIPDMTIFNRLTGDLFFNLYAIRFREEYILFPVVVPLFPKKELVDMMLQAYEIGFVWVEEDVPDMLTFKKQHSNKKEKNNSLQISDPDNPFYIDLGTGSLTIEQAIMMLNNLPVDISYVDEHDTVQYFSNPANRIFTRSKAIIGRKVENCHPPSSVQAVKDLIDAFRSGKKDKESFWIQMGGKFLLIQYFALRDEKKNYRGTLEVSQDITDINKLDGEKRLME